ncbi:OPT oligopeptide transporter protein-domain-containing protein [Podospora didyma]|uniref:OPT oligopeptide transporter protein-domain-containing protein n=1 Tax=Podospora didyma TaxID=330526 RepID=A0AAE0NSP9_9PEZI|nr:OPT oligopeptide transporter protein-domain-containing protein [Podospora didyma]
MPQRSGKGGGKLASSVDVVASSTSSSSSSSPLLSSQNPQQEPDNYDGNDDDDDDTDVSQQQPRRRKTEITGQSFTARGVVVGLLVGLVICFSNMYFGLQTGWVSTMTMPASLMGFGIFKLMGRHLDGPFTPVENVLVQTVAGSMAIMPLGCGFVGVLPAMNYLLRKDEQGPIVLSLWKLILWSLGLCYFGVVFAVPLRRQVIIREQLKFPSGFSTAVLIGMLHGQTRKKTQTDAAGFASLAADSNSHDDEPREPGGTDPESGGRDPDSWRKNVQLLLTCFLISGILTFAMYFLPVLRNIPIFGTVAAGTWLWTLNPSLAYVGQGIIMGSATTLHMLLGAVLGWGVLSPLAKSRGWASGPVDDWERGSKGWIVWTSLAIMLADSIVSLGYLALRSAAQYIPPQTREKFSTGLIPDRVKGLFSGSSKHSSGGYTPIDAHGDSVDPIIPARPLSGFDSTASSESGDTGEGDIIIEKEDDDDAPPEQQISDRVVAIGLVLSIVFCIFCIHVVFGDLVPLYATVTAVAVALLLSIMGVRALGETDLNPVSGISKLAQLFFALITPQSNKSSVLINLVAGAVSEAGALQAGDLMQDLKTGHLLGAAPKAQFWGQVIGATVGAIVSAFIYRLYQRVYIIPNDLFPVPTAHVWIFTARLVTGEGLPPMAKEWAMGSAVLFSATTALRIFATGKRWHSMIPGGIAVAVGMYNVPSFTLARAMGGLLSWWWRSFMGRQDTPLIVVASGFILGEGFLSIVNLIMQSSGVPHL